MTSNSGGNIIRTPTIGQCWLETVRCVLERGESHHDEDVDLLEVLGLSVEVSHPSEQDPIIASHGDPVVMARTLAKFVQGACMPDRPFTYGERIHDMQGINQFDWLVNRLRRKPETKSATIGLLIPGSSASQIPCLTTLDAKIRRGRLEFQFFFRSQNVFGRQYANLAALARLQNSLAERCEVQTGSLRGYVASAHIYSFDLADARRLCDGDAVEIRDRYAFHAPRSVRRPST